MPRAPPGAPWRLKKTHPRALRALESRGCREAAKFSGVSEDGAPPAKPPRSMWGHAMVPGCDNEGDCCCTQSRIGIHSPHGFADTEHSFQIHFMPSKLPFYLVKEPMGTYNGLPLIICYLLELCFSLCKYSDRCSKWNYCMYGAIHLWYPVLGGHF